MAWHDTPEVQELLGRLDVMSRELVSLYDEQDLREAWERANGQVCEAIRLYASREQRAFLEEAGLWTDIVGISDLFRHQTKFYADAMRLSPTQS